MVRCVSAERWSGGGAVMAVKFGFWIRASVGVKFLSTVSVGMVGWTTRFPTEELKQVDEAGLELEAGGYEGLDL